MSQHYQMMMINSEATSLHTAVVGKQCLHEWMRRLWFGFSVLESEGKNPVLWVGAEFAACSGLCWLKSLLTHVENSHFVLAPHRCRLISEPSRAEEALWSFWLQATTFHKQLQCSPPSKHYVYWNQQKKVIGFLSCTEAEIGWLNSV